MRLSFGRDCRKVGGSSEHALRWEIFLLRKQRGHRLFRISLDFLHLGYSRQLACRHCGGTDGPCLIAYWRLAPSLFLFASGSGSPLFLYDYARYLMLYFCARFIRDIFFILTAVWFPLNCYIAVRSSGLLGYSGILVFVVWVRWNFSTLLKCL